MAVRDGCSKISCVVIFLSQVLLIEARYGVILTPPHNLLPAPGNSSAWFPSGRRFAGASLPPDHAFHRARNAFLDTGIAPVHR